MRRSNKRSVARACAFQVLYGLSFTPVSNSEELRLAFLQSVATGRQDEPDNETDAGDGSGDLTGFAWELVEGVWNAGAELDAAINRFSHNWRIDRMGRVELTLLRLAVFEMLFRQDVPPKVAINEALELSRQFGAHGAKSFINGILDAAAKAVESGELTHKTEPCSNP